MTKSVFAFFGIQILSEFTIFYLPVVIEGVRSKSFSIQDMSFITTLFFLTLIIFDDIKVNESWAIRREQ